MAIDRTVNGINVDTAGDNAKSPVWNSTTKVFDMATPSGGSATMASFTSADTSAPASYFLWVTTPVISVGSPPTMDANGSLSLPINTTWKVVIYGNASLTNINDSISFAPFITNTTTGVGQSFSGGAILTPNHYGNGYATVSPISVTTNPTNTEVTLYVKVGSVAKFLRVDGSGSSITTGTAYSTLTVEKIA